MYNINQFGQTPMENDVYTDYCCINIIRPRHDTYLPTRHMTSIKTPTIRNYFSQIYFENVIEKTYTTTVIAFILLLCWPV